MALRVFLDANVLFSAARSAGTVRDLLELLESKRHTLVADSYVVEEARRNLSTKADAHSALVLHAMLARIELHAMRPRPLDAGTNAALAWLHEKDQPVLLGAAAARCDVLVTGDKTHFGPAWGTSVLGVAIYSPTQLLHRVLAE